MIKVFAEIITLSLSCKISFLYSYKLKSYKWKINVEKYIEDLEVVQTGFANGVAPGFPFTDQEKSIND
jgi:hypothetical protein